LVDGFSIAIGEFQRKIATIARRSFWAPEIYNLAFPCRVDWRRRRKRKLVRGNVHWRLLLLLDAHHYLFQRPVLRDSIHSEDMLYAYTYADANTGAHAYAMSVRQAGYRL